MTTEKYDVQDVLDAVMLAESTPSYDALIRWIQRYPKFSKELENFFVAWSDVEISKHYSDPVDIDEAVITERAVKRVLAKLRRHQRTRS